MTIRFQKVSNRRLAVLVAATGMLAGAWAAQAAVTPVSACYDVADADTGSDLGPVIRILARPVGSLGSKETLHDIHGRLTRRTGETADGRPEVEMSLITGTLVVVKRQGAQMSLLRNFVRGEQGATGLIVLDCGTERTRMLPAKWHCASVVVSDDLNSKVVEGRNLLLTRVNEERARCNDFGLRSD